jgi:hypothetical protein
VTKVCRICGESKPLSEFYKNPAMTDGHRGECKACKVASTNKYQREHREQSRRYWQSYRDRVKNDPRFRDSQVRATRSQRAKFPEKHAARVAAQTAVAKGQLVRQPCEVCGESKVDAHHDDYAKPLAVRWLCRRHHAQADAERRLRDSERQRAA